MPADPVYGGRVVSPRKMMLRFNSEMDHTRLARLSAAIETPRLRLEPTVAEHARDLAEALGDPELHRHIGGSPRSAEAWAAQLEAWAGRTSPDGTQLWLNWVVAVPGAGQIVGWLQATVIDGHADIAFMIGTPWQGHRYATEAAQAVLDHLLASGVTSVGASIGKENRPSQAVAERLGFVRTGETDDDGEERWTAPSRSG
ncbi:MAG: hypothetical protein QOF57_2864 [Frankiaceae bacterium]|jgi:RimJ/RimL family protein N-acetyltransferase|nr:hypothetical protein [Frankiaceae bacterium]